MRRRYTLVGVILAVVGASLVLYGYDYATCPIPTGSYGSGTCVVLDYAYVGPGAILIGLGVMALLYGVLVPRRSGTDSALPPRNSLSDPAKTGKPF